MKDIDCISSQKIHSNSIEDVPSRNFEYTTTENEVHNNKAGES